MAHNKERVILAGGCFWGMQDLIRQAPGVISTRVGYSGGELTNATYSQVKTGKTGHAEALEVIYDPDTLNFRDLLALFFQIHDPTTINRQGNDIGSQYRSAIFYTHEKQHEIALEVIQQIEASRLWPGKVVTEIKRAGEFWEGEPLHQDYLQRTPNGYTCHFPRPNWQLPKATR